MCHSSINQSPAVHQAAIHTPIACLFQVKWRGGQDLSEPINTHTHPNCMFQVKWTELKAFLDWLQGSVFLVRLPPGDSQRLYIDMTDAILMSVRIPDLSMQTSRYDPGVPATGVHMWTQASPAGVLNMLYTPSHASPSSQVIPLISYLPRPPPLPLPLQAIHA